MKKLICATLATLILAASLVACDKYINIDNFSDSVISDTTNEHNKAYENNTVNSDFTNYETIINMYKKIIEISSTYNEQKDLNGEYGSMFNLNDEREIEWYQSIFQSVLLYKSCELTYGYSIGDINGDNQKELLLLLDDYTLIAVFSLYNEKPILLDRFWNRYCGYIDTNGFIHTVGSNGAYFTVNSIYKIPANAGTTELISEFGTNGLDDNNSIIYYKLVDSEKLIISKEQYDELYNVEKNLQSNDSTKNNQNIKFEPLVQS